MKLAPLHGSFRGWWFVVALVVGPAIVLAALGLRALRVERMGREQELWQQQSRLILLVDGAISNAIAAIEGDLRRGELRPPGNSPAQEGGRPAYFTPLVFDSRQLLIFPDDRIFFGEVGMRPRQAPALPLSGQIARLTEQARVAEAQNQEQTALDAYRRLGAAEPRLLPWADLNIARIRHRQSDAEITSVFQSIEWKKEDSVSPSGIPVAMLACSYVSQLPDERRSAFEGLLRETLASLRSGGWWLSHQQRAFYDAELVRLLRGLRAGKGVPPGEDARLGYLAAIEKAARQSAPRRHDASTRNYDYTEDGGFLLLWSPAGNQADTWHGAAARAERIDEWLRPLLTPLIEGLPYGVMLRDSRQQPLWTSARSGAAVGRWERLRSVPEWELGFMVPPETAGIDPRRILWYGFIILPLVMLIVGIAAATRVVRKELELGRMQSDFIAAVSHEFKSPLTSIRLLVERIAGRRHSTPDSVDQYCQAIDNEAGRLERLVNRLLEWQHIEAGRRRYRLEPGSLAEIARNAVGLFRPQAEAKGVSLDLKTADDMPSIRFDRAVMTDVFENLIDNAIKYSAAGGRISVELHSDEARVTVEVRDEGIGIDPDDLPHIFEKFYRGTRGNQEDVRGTGLGLALAKAALDAHQGKIDVKSTPGKGSRFILTLPVCREEEGNAPGSDRG